MLNLSQKITKICSREHANIIKLRSWKVYGALGIIILALFFYREFFVAVSGQGAPIFFEITKNEVFSQITKRLDEKNLIRGKSLFIFYARIARADRKIKAGRFRINPNLTPAEILAFLSNPENGEISLTIPEGFSIFDIDDRLFELGLIQKGDFIAWSIQSGESLEGYLFPDTYFVFAKNFHPSQLGENMRNVFVKRVAEGMQSELKQSKRNLKEIITMASILEKEVRTKEDWPIVSGILWKRLDHGWPLQADATLLYGRSERKISRADLKKETAYNTYLEKGLPPTPIGNPGLLTIQAALQPADSLYWFYLTDREGKVHYAKTNAEQNANIQKFLNN